MELTPRLRAIADQVPCGTILADVGTDHAYLPVYLLLKGTIKAAIAADLREGPLCRAQETAAQFGVTDQMSFRLCDGLSGIGNDEADVISIAGMGGETIASILDAAPWSGEKLLLLQPMTAYFELRQWLQQHGYCILRETIVQEGKRLYSIWAVTGGKMPPLSMGELWAGVQNHEPLRTDYLTMIIGKLEKSLAGHLAAQEPDRKMIEFYSESIAELNQMKEQLRL